MHGMARRPHSCRAGALPRLFALPPRRSLTGYLWLADSTVRPIASQEARGGPTGGVRGAAATRARLGRARAGASQECKPSWATSPSLSPSPSSILALTPTPTPTPTWTLTPTPSLKPEHNPDPNPNPEQVQAKLGGLDDGFVGTIEAYMKKADSDGLQVHRVNGALRAHCMGTA